MYNLIILYLSRIIFKFQILLNYIYKYYVTHQKKPYINIILVKIEYYCYYSTNIKKLLLLLVKFINYYNDFFDL